MTPFTWMAATAIVFLCLWVIGATREDRRLLLEIKNEIRVLRDQVQSLQRRV